jgi:hypothetical protein
MPVMIAVTVPVAMTDVANVDVDVTMPVTVTVIVTMPVTVTVTAMFAVALGELQHVRRVPHLWERESDRKRLAGHHSGCAGRKADQRSESNLSEHGTLPPLTDELGPFSLYAYGMTIAILVHGESIRVFAVRRRKTNHRGRTYLDLKAPRASNLRRRVDERFLGNLRHQGRGGRRPPQSRTGVLGTIRASVT